MIREVRGKKKRGERKGDRWEKEERKGRGRERK